MPAPPSPPGVSSSAPGPELVERTAKHSSACRCGTRIPAGRQYLAIGGFAPSLRGIFDDQSFCSIGCVRAQILESIDTPAGESQVSDLREAYLQLASALAQMLNQWQADWFRASRSS